MRAPQPELEEGAADEEDWAVFVLGFPVFVLVFLVCFALPFEPELAA
jgi:hypothetical protein